MSEYANPFEERLAKAGEFLSDALDIYEVLWHLYPDYRKEMQKRTMVIIQVFENAMKKKEGWIEK